MSSDSIPDIQIPDDCRRRWMSDSATALGAIALTSLLNVDSAQASNPILPAIDPARPYAPRAPHFPA